MMLSTGLAATLETALNAYLDADPEMAAGLAKIAGARVGISLTGTGLEWCLVPGAGRIDVQPGLGEAPDAVIRLAPLALVRIAMAEPGALPREDVAIEGDAEMAERLWAVLRGVEIDWEEWLSGHLGDIVAHEVASRLRGMAAWGRRAGDHLAADLGEYATEEAHLTPPRNELDDFMNAVDHVREDLDRLEARLARLASRVQDDRA